MQVIEGGKLVPKKRKITLRMLLAHTGTLLVFRDTCSSGADIVRPQPALRVNFDFWRI